MSSGKMGDSVSLSSLLCSENESCLDETQEEEEEEEEQRLSCIDDMGLSPTEDEYIEMLISSERNYCSSENIGSFDDCSTENWLRCAYMDAVQWILKMRAVFGFSFQTAYLSVTYLYRFLLRREVDQNGKCWAIQLLSVACLSLAVKMEECKIPPLSEFRADGYTFDWQVIQRMELMVLNTLEWRMSSVTPFAYLHYFSTKFSNESRPNTVLSKASGLVLETTKVLNLMKYRQSAIAAAAVLVSSDQTLTKRSVDYQMRGISSCGCLENEHVFACYNQILELGKRNMKVTHVIKSPDLSAIYASSVDVVDGGASATSISSKRRRLALNEPDPDGHTSNR
ncbi:cyclin-D5-1-like protein [Cinnamomum micranthum f. kanehirae]|uniref:Cyclin-D5-1-like protein n=1 Tax=Cinnamomum micranthum f. kanehirae TaxID=337451 RepID=A0A443NHH6_9MAGN|nr:cyclin-D5-1-like protein [Cinnamomum micranthum f. kanehirae]